MAAIKIHPLTKDPTAAWEELSKYEKVIKIEKPFQNGTIADTMARIVCMSDTHAKTSKINFDIPWGDIFIHAGDFTSEGREDEVIEFSNWLGKLPHKYKIVIAGNHERSFDPRILHDQNTMGPKDKLTNCIYLEDSAVTINGLKIYGSPWQPLFQKKTAFKIPRGEMCLEKWDLIPNDTDILITHVPPLGFNDLCCDGLRAGCVELLTTIQTRVKPKYHIFGHIHEGYGVCSDGVTIFINAATCTVDYEPTNCPIVFDIHLPEGINKFR